MVAYAIFLRDAPPHDPAALEEYARLNRAGPADPKLRPLVVYGRTEALEGPAPDGMVMLQFPTIEDARAWYDSPGYQAALPHRLQGADYRAFIVEGLG